MTWYRPGDKAMPMITQFMEHIWINGPERLNKHNNITKPQGLCTVPHCSDIWQASRHFCCLTGCYIQNTIDIWLLGVISQSLRTRRTIEQSELANRLSQRDQQQWFQHQDTGNSDWFQTLSTRFIYHYDLNISKCINALLGPISKQRCLTSIRQSKDSITFNMGISIPGKDKVFILRWGACIPQRLAFSVVG